MYQASTPEECGCSTSWNANSKFNKNMSSLSNSNPSAKFTDDQPLKNELHVRAIHKQNRFPRKREARSHASRITNPKQHWKTTRAIRDDLSQKSSWLPYGTLAFTNSDESSDRIPHDHATQNQNKQESRAAKHRTPQIIQASKKRRGHRGITCNPMAAAHDRSKPRELSPRNSPERPARAHREREKERDRRALTPRNWSSVASCFDVRRAEQCSAAQRGVSFVHLESLWWVRNGPICRLLMYNTWLPRTAWAPLRPPSDAPRLRRRRRRRRPCLPFVGSFRGVASLSPSLSPSLPRLRYKSYGHSLSTIG